MGFFKAADAGGKDRAACLGIVRRFRTCYCSGTFFTGHSAFAAAEEEALLWSAVGVSDPGEVGAIVQFQTFSLA